MSKPKEKKEKPQDKEEFKYCYHKSSIVQISSFKAFNTTYLLTVGGEGDCLVHNLENKELILKLMLTNDDSERSPGGEYMNTQQYNNSKYPVNRNYNFISKFILSYTNVYPDTPLDEVEQRDRQMVSIAPILQVGQEQGVIVTQTLDLTDIILYDDQSKVHQESIEGGMTFAYQFPSENEQEEELIDQSHDSAITVLEKIKTNNTELIVSASQGLWLCVHKVSVTNPQMQLVKKQAMPSVLTDLKCKTNQDGAIEQLIASCQDGHLRTFTFSKADMSDLTISQIIKVASFPLLKIAPKVDSRWITTGDSSNYQVLDINLANNQKGSYYKLPPISYKTYEFINAHTSLIKNITTDKKLILTQSEGIIKLWDINDQRLMETITVSKDTLNTFQFEGEYLFVGGCDKVVRYQNQVEILDRYQNFLLMEDENKWQDKWNVAENKSKKKGGKKGGKKGKKK